MRPGAAVLACLLAWTAAGAVAAPQGFDAQYRLHFNEQLVGRTFFRLRTTAEAYTFEALTVPDGDYRKPNGEHEILEISEGGWSDGVPVPRVYTYHLREAAGDHLFEQEFRWEDGELRLRSDDRTGSAALEPGTQDRLSYLLRLAQAASEGKREFAFAIAEPERTIAMTFRALLTERLDLLPGKVEALGVECFTDGDTPDRTVWVAPAWAYVPALIERAVADGRVRMTLESIDLLGSGQDPEP